LNGITIGITATQRGLVERQREVAEELFLRFDPARLVHGDCVGGDEDIHYLFQQAFPKKTIIIRPCDIRHKRAFCIGFHEEHPEEPPLMRNQKIVNESHILLGFPGEQNEVTRSGTWSTIRYAKRIGKPVIVIYPEAKKTGLLGPVEEEFNMGKFGGK
jgi:hypothetical protein